MHDPEPGHQYQVAGGRAHPSGISSFRITRAGEPAANEFGGMSLVTTELAPTVDPSPMVTPGRTTTFRPSHTLLPTTVGPLQRGAPGSIWWRLSSMIDEYWAIRTLLPTITSCHASIQAPPFKYTSSPITRVAPGATATLTFMTRPEATNRSPITALPRILK